jgi:hypothetical protein
VNLITDLLIQHSQSTGFEKSLEMLTHTLRQLTESNTSTTNSSQSSSNSLENLLIKRLQSSVQPQSQLTSNNLIDFQYHKQQN